MHHIRTTFFDEKGRALIPVTPSLHSLCAHSWKVFEIFLRPIVIFSEQALEHWNKHMAGFKSGCGTHSRQHSSKKNLYDILARMLWMTNPLVVKRRRQKKMPHLWLPGSHYSIKASLQCWWPSWPR